MQIDRKRFLLMAAGLSQSLAACVTQPSPVIAGPRHNPYGPARPTPGQGAQPQGIAPAPVQPGTQVATPREECLRWNPQGECTEFESNFATPDDGCTEWRPQSEWNPQRECIAWGQPTPTEECNNWDPSGECAGWVGDRPIGNPTDECVAWHPNGQCSAIQTLTPTDECSGWGPTNECNRWIFFTD